ncbi:hypothetical protein GQX73_g376 [Xylaria multiplex]|uniref:Myb-like domain-containing protein n=1 Tax=Xylaria multiplex TaxID=323545 RepID=A0A7C8J8E9_9PEZI|nr:hypothetical protein GQX73_g376 [Xylaria multiplex]
MAPPESSERQSWTPQEDRILNAVVTQATQPGQSISWHSVASHLPGRSNKDCRKRWHYKIARDFRKGPWTAAEDEGLRRAVEIHGTKWTKVSEALGSRNGDQCWKRWHDKLDPRIDHSPWTSEEDATLLQVVEKMGTNWRVIVNQHFPRRTPLSAKNRYGILQRRLDNGDPSSVATTMDSGDKTTESLESCIVATSRVPLAAETTATSPLTPSPCASPYSDSNLDMPGEDEILPFPGDELDLQMDTSAPELMYSFDLDQRQDATGASTGDAFPMDLDFWTSHGPLANPGQREDYPLHLGVPSSHGGGVQMQPLPLPGKPTITTAMHAEQAASEESNATEEIKKSKVLHLKVFCDASHLENTLQGVSKAVNEMVINGTVKHVQFSVD